MRKSNVGRRNDSKSRAANKKVAALVGRLETIALTESRWEVDPLRSLRDLLKAVEDLCAAQMQEEVASKMTSPVDSWKRRWEVFEEWIEKNGNVDHSAVRAEKCGEEGVGLVAERDIREGERVINVPRRLMLTADVALQDPELRRFIEGDPILRRIESLSLSLCVVRERLDEDSMYRPYLDILPETYSTPLWFNADDVSALTGSPSRVKAIARIRGNVRQYCHIYQSLRTSSVVSDSSPSEPCRPSPSSTSVNEKAKTLPVLLFYSPSLPSPINHTRQAFQRTNSPSSCSVGQ